jgi:hypothetical protein
MVAREANGTWPNTTNRVHRSHRIGHFLAGGRRADLAGHYPDDAWNSRAVSKQPDLGPQPASQVAQNVVGQLSRPAIFPSPAAATRVRDCQPCSADWIASWLRVAFVRNIDPGVAVLRAVENGGGGRPKLVAAGR